jgi:hypothetical protein
MVELRPQHAIFWYALLFALLFGMVEGFVYMHVHVGC